MKEGMSLHISSSFLSLSLLGLQDISRDHRSPVLLFSFLYLFSAQPPKAFLTDLDTLFHYLCGEPAPVGQRLRDELFL